MLFRTIYMHICLALAIKKTHRRRPKIISDSSCSNDFPFEVSSISSDCSERSDSDIEKLVCERVPQQKKRFPHRRHHRRPFPPCPLPPCPLPPCPLPPCPLPPCLPKSFPCPPAPYPCPPKPYPCPPAPYPINCRIVLDSLDQLLIEKSADLGFIINSRGQQFINAVKDSLANVGIIIGNRATALNNALNTTILGYLSASNTSTTNAVLSSINSTNSTLLSGVNALISNTNSAISTLITNLAAQPAATIATTVQDLTTSAGLLSQLLSITTTLSNGVATLFSSTTPTEITNVTNILAGATQSLQTQVTQAIASTNGQILQTVSQALVAETSVIVNLFERFLTEIIVGTEALFSEYGYEVRRIVSNALGCGGLNSGSDLFRSRRPSYRTQIAPVLTNPISNFDSLVNTNIGASAFSGLVPTTTA